MGRTLIAITTYQKNDALEVLLKSLQDCNYFDGNHILICDDSAPGAKKLAKKFKCIYTGGKEPLGISRNKNRCIKYFLDNKDGYDNLLLLDDDLVFVAPGFIDACVATKHPHVTGYLGEWVKGIGLKFDERKQISGNPFFIDFPSESENRRGIIYCGGCQGIALFMVRELVENVRYFHLAPGRYGYEHSIYSNVINKYLGRYLDWFPVLKNTPKYLVGNYNHPNIYDVGKHGDGGKNKNPWHIDNNGEWWQKKKLDIYSGINYINSKHGVPENEEIINYANMD